MNYTKNLNDPEKIQYVQGILPEEIEILFWKLEDALYENNKQLAIILFDMLVYVAMHNKPLFSHLKEPFRKRLKEIGYELYEKSISKTKLPIEIKPAFLDKIIPFNKEKELRDYLSTRMNIFSKVLGKVRFVGKEIETDFEFKCDLVVENSEFLFPIELKIVQANHAVVSQIDKYCSFFYRKMRYNHFKKIQGIVIANGFCEWSINEMRRNGHFLFDIAPGNNEKDIFLRKI